MPFQSEAQRRYLWLKHPEIARKWANEEKRKQPESKKKVVEAMMKRKWA